MFPFFFELDELREKKKKTGTFSHSLVTCKSHLPLSLSDVEIKDSKTIRSSVCLLMLLLFLIYFDRKGSFY